MARVRQKGTSAERAVAVVLREIGAAYRLNVRKLPGSPDFANRRRKWAVFVQGCFWHHHTGCRAATVPKSNEAFWRAKFIDNRKRDAAAVNALRREGYRVILIWECETRDARRLAARLSAVLKSR